ASYESTLKIIKEKIGLTPDYDLISLPESKINWFNYVGWAASVILSAGLIYVMISNNDLKEHIETVETEKEFLEQQIELAQDDLKEAENLLAIMRDKDIIAVPLAGQAAFQDTYAKVYWDKATNAIYLDAQGLPEPPEGKVYQLWSLTLNPLTPTSLGVIANFESDDNKIFTIENPNASEAFGITLEPEGGSPTPTMEQLYTLGVVSSSP
ncbi:MAG: anti-sigma factor, partial [Bacteroidia bacterium]|nr:anti-sigma factor [Bacteroidia bacterium]